MHGYTYIYNYFYVCMYAYKHIYECIYIQLWIYLIFPFPNQYPRVIFNFPNLHICTSLSRQWGIWFPSFSIICFINSWLSVTSLSTMQTASSLYQLCSFSTKPHFLRYQQLRHQAGKEWKMERDREVGLAICQMTPLNSVLMGKEGT